MFITGSDVVKQLYSAPTPLKLERNQIEVDLTFEGVNVTLALATISSCSKRFFSPAQIARLVYFHGEGKWLIGTEITGHPLEICFLYGQANTTENLSHAIKEIQQEYGIRLQITHSASLVGSSIPPEWISNILSCSFEYELVRSCGWVQVGKESNILTIVEAVSVPKSGQEKETRNVQMISVGGDLNRPHLLRINSSINKYYPLDYSQVPKNPMDSFVNVVVLPTFTEAVCMGHATVRDLPAEMQNPESFKKYWWTHHAFKLTDESLQQLVKVRISESISLVYPLTCVWKLRPCVVPSYTKLYESSMNTRIMSDTEWVRGVWQYMCGLRLSSGAFHKPDLQRADECVPGTSKRARIV